MRVTLDLNVVLDVLLARQDSLECSEVMSLARSGAIEAVFPAHELSTIYYLSRKVMNDHEVRDAIRAISKLAKIIDLSEPVWKRALDSPMADFEDAIVAETAVAVDADFIVTRNVKDFFDSPIPAVTARAFMESVFRA